MNFLLIPQINVKKSYEKLTEEYWEVSKEHFLHGSRKDKLAECMDLIQSTISYMLAETDFDLDEIEEANKEHVRKLLARGINVVGGVAVDINSVKEEKRIRNRNLKG